MRRPPADRDQGDVELGVAALELLVQREGALHPELHVRGNLALPRQPAAQDDDGHLARAAYRVVQLDLTPEIKVSMPHVKIAQ